LTKDWLLISPDRAFDASLVPETCLEFYCVALPEILTRSPITDSGMILRLAAFEVWRKELSDSATLLPISGQSGLASVQTEPFKYKIHGNLGGMR
jgi:hypothetical protein